MNKFLSIIVLFSALVLCSCEQEEANKKQTEELPIAEDVLPIQTEEASFKALPIKEIDTLCYEEVFYTGKDKNKFYVKFYLNGKFVSGYLEHHFYNTPIIFGQLEGEKKGNQIKAQYNYFLDGGTKSQIVEFLIYDQFVIQKTGELEEKNGMQFLNPSTAKFTDTFIRVVCNIKPVNI